MDEEPMAVNASTSSTDVDRDMETYPCLFCEDLLPVDANYQLILKHLLLQHQFVVADVPCLANFKKYLNYWRGRFQNKDLREFCSVIRTNSRHADPAAQEEYYLLSDDLPEDKIIRNSLHQDLLKEVLQRNELERSNTMSMYSCMFCDHGPTAYLGNRNDVFDHLLSVHGFKLGHPDNIVYAEEFLQLITDKLAGNVCLWCEKTFKDRWTLKEHMRKKNHKRIKVDNPIYDKYYLVNYLEPGKSWREILGSFDPSIENEFKHDHDLSAWCEEDSVAAAAAAPSESHSCLFCVERVSRCNLQHMRAAHGFDWLAIKAEHRADFYAQVKLVTFVRHRVSEWRCVFGCPATLAADGITFASERELLAHMSAAHAPLTKHDAPRCTQLPRDVWDQPSHFFIQVDEDLTLCNDDEYATDSIVVTEEQACLNPRDSVLFDAAVRRDLLQNAYCTTAGAASDTDVGSGAAYEAAEDIDDLVAAMQQRILS